MCIRDRRNGKLRLTEWANAHVDACCLRFVRSYYRDNRTRYVYGQLNSDEEYNGRGLALSMEQGHENVLMQARAMSEILTGLPGSFHGTLKAHMKRLNVTRERLAKRRFSPIQRLNACAARRKTIIHLTR